MSATHESRSTTGDSAPQPAERPYGRDPFGLGPFQSSGAANPIIPHVTLLEWTPPESAGDTCPHCGAPASVTGTGRKATATFDRDRVLRDAIESIPPQTIENLAARLANIVKKSDVRAALRWVWGLK